ncbi:hypothetical protein LIER_07124 [Lithospermum erythrorhizon]|uniref:Uncharacterized protein n=1 Tax=Lithospermum erythrorhizon TaxID=34254 RepID=A0AAV3P776_LITER
MAGKRRPLFRKSKVRKVLTSSSPPARNEPSPSTTTAAATSASTAEKRPASAEGRPKVFTLFKKHVVQRPNRIEHVSISEDLPTTSPPPPTPTNSVNPPRVEGHRGYYPLEETRRLSSFKAVDIRASGEGF